MFTACCPCDPIVGIPIDDHTHTRVENFDVVSSIHVQYITIVMKLVVRLQLQQNISCHFSRNSCMSFELQLFKGWSALAYSDTYDGHKSALYALPKEVSNQQS